jgi:hypothetical protein
MLYIIDELELHIHTSMQKDLLNAIIKLIPNDSQLWLATHSIGFLIALKEAHEGNYSIIHFDENIIKNGSTDEKKTLEPIDITRDNWQKILEVPLDDLANLVAPKKIVYCEGKKESKNGQEDGLDAEVYNTIFKDRLEVQFISSGGSTEAVNHANNIITLTIFNKALNAIKFYVLTDNLTLESEEGATNYLLSCEKDEHKKNENYNKLKNGETLKINENLLCIKLNRREIENYFFDPEIVKKFIKVNATESSSYYDNKLKELGIEDKDKRYKKIRI